MAALYYVGTLARNVMVEADDETDARAKGQIGLDRLDADMPSRIGRDTPVRIQTVRLATPGEIELWNWHQEMTAREAE